MAYNEKTADRVRAVLKRRKGFCERKMFGGLAFMLHGNMCCGVLNKDIVLRLGDEGAVEALKERHTRPMDFTGRPLKSMVYVSSAGHRREDQLRSWIGRAIRFVKTLPAK